MTDKFSQFRGQRAALLIAVAAVAWLAAFLLLPLPWVLDVVAALLFALIVDFVLYFWFAYLRQHRSLSRVVAELTAIHGTADGANVTDLDPVRALMASQPRLAHPWEEFEDTLHAQSHGALDENGEAVVAEFRQTVPAEAYFNARTMVEGPLNTDYFRHLPGILTGLGIVGTFSGLIMGLAGFGVAADPAQVNASVQSLIDAVREAFIISAVAIGSAMVITWVEKTLAARLFDRTDDLQVALDQMFDAGVDEEYLSAIADRSAESAIELSRLRNGLAEDLRDAIGKLGDQLETAVASNATHTGAAVGALGERLEAAVQTGSERTGEIVTTQLEAPLTQMTAFLETTQQDQRESVQHLLAGTLAEFSSQLENVVGEKLSTAAGHVTAAADLIGTTLTDAPQAIQAVVAGYGETLERSSAEAREAMAATSEGVRSALQGVAGDATRLIEASTTGARDTLDRVADAAAPMVEHSERISAASASLADSLNTNASRLDSAFERFQTVGEALDESISAARVTTEHLGNAAQAVKGGTDALGTSTLRVREASEALQRSTTLLRDTAEIQQTENDGRRELADRVTHAADELAAAQRALDGFLEGVADALAKSHEQFASQVQSTLAKVHTSFGAQLGQATTTVAEAVGNLNDAVENELNDAVGKLIDELQRLTPASR